MPTPLPRVTRTGTPDWVTRAGSRETVDPGALGGQAEWAFAIPWAYRALASPTTAEPMLAAPTERDPHEQRRAYWTTLLHLLCFRLGWASPERGLAWWAEEGYPASDPTLALIAATWLADGRFPLLREWLAEQPVVFMPGIANRVYTDVHPGADLPQGGLRVVGRSVAAAPGRAESAPVRPAHPARLRSCGLYPPRCAAAGQLNA